MDKCPTLELMQEIETKARDLLQGKATHTEWSFVFSDWDNKNKRLVDTLHNWNNDSMTIADEKYFQVLVYDALDGACILLTDKPLVEVFAGSVHGLRLWIDDFTASLYKVTI